MFNTYYCNSFASAIGGYAVVTSPPEDRRFHPILNVLREKSVMDRRPERQIIAIDLLRFACAMAVLAYHFWTVFPLTTSSPTLMFGVSVSLPTWAASSTASGWVGVEIFFVISGYVIAMSAEHADRAAFARSRILRLLPAGLICASLTAALLLLSGALPPAEAATRLAATVTMLPFGPRLDGSWWTLQVETSFYLVVAFALRADRRNGARLERLGIGLTAWSTLYYAQAAAHGNIPDLISGPACSFCCRTACFSRWASRFGRSRRAAGARSVERRPRPRWLSRWSR